MRQAWKASKEIVVLSLKFAEQEGSRYATDSCPVPVARGRTSSILGGNSTERHLTNQSHQAQVETTSRHMGGNQDEEIPDKA